MANSVSGNVIFVDTTGYTDSRSVKICSVKYIGAASGTATITAGTSGSGSLIWKESGTANQAADEIEARVDGFHVAVASGAQVLIYLES